jgi:hypothetical protein
MGSEFRGYLFPLDHPRLEGLNDLDPCEYADSMRADPAISGAMNEWLAQFQRTEFGNGITTDGTRPPGLFVLGADERAPAAEAGRAAREFIDGLPPSSRARLCHPIDSKVWRAWMNPEFYLNRYGLRLEELDEAHVARALNLLQASLSSAGYAKTRELMAVNAFLGTLVALPKLMNEYSYNINVFGDPTDGGPWGWNFYGHHVCLNCLFIGHQQVLTPVFFGAEPNEVDEGERVGTVLFTDQEALGLNLIQTLPQALLADAVLFHDKRDPAMPPGRRHPADELHLAGAFQDNRVIPYEGLNVARMDAAQQELLIDLVALFLDYQPEGPKQARLADVRRHLDDTWFCWIGGTTYGEAFYYRIQSPVIIVEFDHHAGVFLANTEPKRFHVHTIVRTPNGNDYGVDLIRQATATPQHLKAPR